jgi:hypothetical protein
MITRAVDLSVRFPSGFVTSDTFYVTPLDSSCFIVLGHNWLTRYNPLIDWVLGSITFQTSIPENANTPTSPPELWESVPPPQPDNPDKPPREAPRISFINAAAFVRACKLEGSEQFSIHLRPEDSKLRSVSTQPDTPEKIDLSSVPSDYHDFPDVFSKRKADTLAPHREFDLKIDLEEGASPPLGTVYPVSSTELESLREFIDEHLSYGFIRTSSSVHGAPVSLYSTARKTLSSLAQCVAPVSSYYKHMYTDYIIVYYLCLTVVLT